MDMEARYVHYCVHRWNYSLFYRLCRPSPAALPLLSARLPKTGGTKAEGFSYGVNTGPVASKLPSVVHCSYLESIADKLNDEEWQRERRKESAELQRRRELEEEEEMKKAKNYRNISSRIENIPAEDVKEAKELIASFIRAGEEIEEKIIEAANAGKLTMVVLLVIQNRLDLARHEDQRHVIQALDLLYRRVEAEMMRRAASPALRFLDDLLNLHDGSNRQEWLRRCRQSMINTFPPEDAFTFLAPQGLDIRSHKGPIDASLEDDTLFRVDFIREVDAFLANLVSQLETQDVQGLDPQSVAIRLSEQQKVDAIQQVRDLRKLAIELKW